jgi:type I restriction enzyme S subunit
MRRSQGALGWRTQPLWSMFERRKDVNHPEEPMLSVFRERGVVRKEDFENNNVTAEDRNIYQLVGPGWLLINRMKAWQGSVGISEQRGIVSGHYLCFQPRHNEDSRYLNWLLRSAAYVTLYARLSRGVRPGQSEIDNDELRSLPVLLPSLEEQRRIGEFLDDQVSRIDAAIAARQTALELLRERAKAHLTASLLSSSEDTRVRVRWLIQDEVLGAWGVEPTGEADVRVARVADFDRSLYLVPSVPTLRSLPIHQVARRLLRRGDVLLERSGGTSDRPVGAAVFFEDDSLPTITSNFVSRLRPAEGVYGRYLSLLLAAMYEARLNAAYYTQTTGIQNLDSHAYLRLLVPQRAPSAQQAIVNYVGGMLTATTQLEAALGDHRALLQERKRALIVAAVTGDFDVSSAGRRAAAAVTA